VISATSPQDNYKTVRDLVDMFGDIYPIGWPDVDSEGLVLLNHDGEIANRLTQWKWGFLLHDRIESELCPHHQSLVHTVMKKNGQEHDPLSILVLFFQMNKINNCLLGVVLE
jgi:hypothetical protein